MPSAQAHPVHLSACHSPPTGIPPEVTSPRRVPPRRAEDGGLAAARRPPDAAPQAHAQSREDPGPTGLSGLQPGGCLVPAGLAPKACFQEALQGRAGTVAAAGLGRVFSDPAWPLRPRYPQGRGRWGGAGSQPGCPLPQNTDAPFQPGHWVTLGDNRGAGDLGCVDGGSVCTRLPPQIGRLWAPHRGEARAGQQLLWPKAQKSQVPKPSTREDPLLCPVQAPSDAGEIGRAHV